MKEKHRAGMEKHPKRFDNPACGENDLAHPRLFTEVIRQGILLTLFEPFTKGANELVRIAPLVPSPRHIRSTLLDQIIQKFELLPVPRPAADFIEGFLHGRRSARWRTLVEAQR